MYGIYIIVNDETIEKSILNQGVVSCFLGFLVLFLPCGSIGIVQPGQIWSVER